MRPTLITVTLPTGDEIRVRGDELEPATLERILADVRALSARLEAAADAARRLADALQPRSGVRHYPGDQEQPAGEALCGRQVAPVDATWLRHQVTCAECARRFDDSLRGLREDWTREKHRQDREAGAVRRAE